MKTKNLRIMERGLVDVPVWSDRARDRKWAATVTPNPNAPGGMNRKFWKTGRGDLFRYIVPEDLDLYDVVEFAADNVAWSGNRSPNRIYGIVVGLTVTQLSLCEVASPVEAFLFASDIKEQGRAERAARAAETVVEEKHDEAPTDPTESTS